MNRQVDRIADNVSSALAHHLQMKGRSLIDQVRRAGRRVPSHVRRDLQLIIEAQSLVLNPKKRAQVSLPRLEVAERRVLAYLKLLEPVDLRRAIILDMMRSATMNVFWGSLAGLALLAYLGVI